MGSSLSTRAPRVELTSKSNIVDMGCVSSKTVDEGGRADYGSTDGEYIAKQDVTIWSYIDDGTNLRPHTIPEKTRVKVIEENPKWWKVECGKYKGFASKHYFVHKDTKDPWERKPWYFGDMTREDAESLLGDTANPDGSFLIRHSDKNNGMMVLTLKYFNTRPPEPEIYKYMNYNVKRDGKEVWFSSRKKFKSLCELIDFCMQNKAEGVATKLTNICLIPPPHADPAFEFHNKDHDSLRVPMKELKLDERVGSGQFGDVYRATFRGNLKVAAKQLKTDNEAENDKVLEEFFKEINTMKELNHPNLIQLFAYTTGNKEGNFMIQEFMAEGDLKNYLQKLKKDEKRMKAETKIWSKLLSWNIEVARGMERLESLELVHRDLAARNVLLDQFFRAKVADFGLSMKPSEGRRPRGEKLPVKWTSPEGLFDSDGFTSQGDVWSFGILMYEVLSIGENPYHEFRIKNAPFKETMKKEFDTYFDTGVKLWDADILRCKEPKNLPEFRVNKENFEGVMKVMGSCWDIEPRDRPQFKRLVTSLEALRNDYDYDCS